MHDRRIPLVLWLIDHHPESPLHRLETASISAQREHGGGRAVHDAASNSWMKQLETHRHDARVFMNASLALSDSVQQQVHLLHDAQKLEPGLGTEPLARLYSLILLWVNESGTQSLVDPGTADWIRSEVRNSADIRLVGSVARYLVEGSAQAALTHPSACDFSALRMLATELVTHAEELEPQNPFWTDLIEGVKELPNRSWRR
jgi:hypothetical protein